MKIAIIDLSSVFHRLWHIDRDQVEFKIIGMLKTLQYDKVIVAIDAPPYKRKEVYPNYKANRDIPDPELVGCLRNVQEKILKNGFQIAKSEGWEADDIICTLVKDLTEFGEELFVYGSDKDLLQCTDLIDAFTGIVSTPKSRFNLKRDQIVDYLAMVGDASDNIKGVPGVGDKTATALLTTFGNFEEINKALSEKPQLFTKKTIFDSLVAAKELVKSNILLIKLNDNVTITYEQREVEEMTMQDEVEEIAPVAQESQEVKQVAVQTEPTSYVVKTEQLSFSRSLEPVGLRQAYDIAKTFDKSGLYPRFKGAEQVLLILMRGRELGLGATTSLELIDMIQGKPTMKASGLLALVMSSPKCEYIACKELSSITCTWVTKRQGSPIESKRTFTIQDAERMGMLTKDNWKKQPDVMLQWRCVSALIRQVYPDLINGIYAAEELE